MSGILTTVVENGKKVKVWKQDPYISVKKAVSILRKGEKLPDYTKPDVTLDALQIVEAEHYVEDFIKAGGKFLCERLRPGYIGCEVHIPGGASYIQTKRGKPFGSAVAISNGAGEAVIGVSYIDDEDTPYPIVGLAIALKRAIQGRDTGKTGYCKRWVKNAETKQQLVHFAKRAKAYFNPEKYSYSKGTDPICYENYIIIHERQKALKNI